MKNDDASGTGWQQPPQRQAMISLIKSMNSAGRSARLNIPYDKPGHIDDEVVVALMLEAWKSDQAHDADTYAVEVLRRVTKQVRAHVRKNSGWSRLGGGAKSVADDFAQEVVVQILEDKVTPCHAEVAFGDYVYRRCQDMAAKLYAKKHSKGISLEVDDPGSLEKLDQAIQPSSLSVPSKSPEDVLLELEGQLEDELALKRVPSILEEYVPELPRFAFTFRHMGLLKIESKNKNEVTVTSLMGVTEKTATKYINQAIEIINQRLKK